jgi:hypothetical protein
MITDLDPLYTRSFSHTERATASALRGHRFAHPSLSFQSRAEHEAAFERTHGSLWTPGLLDRLSLPLSRIHE